MTKYTENFLIVDRFGNVLSEADTRLEAEQEIEALLSVYPNLPRKAFHIEVEIDN